MFNNPFDSFHNTVAEAKEEREHLDRLLTISTPRERLLVAAIAVLLIILAVWLFFGSVTRSLAVAGVVVEPGESTPDQRSLQAVVAIEPHVASQIRTGVPAVFKLVMSDLQVVTLKGQIATIAPAPSYSVVSESANPTPAYRIELALDESVDVASSAVMVQVVIDLGRQSPVELLGLG